MDALATIFFALVAIGGLALIGTDADPILGGCLVLFGASFAGLLTGMQV